MKIRNLKRLPRLLLEALAFSGLSQNLFEANEASGKTYEFRTLVIRSGPTSQAVYTNLTRPEALGP